MVSPGCAPSVMPGSSATCAGPTSMTFPVGCGKGSQPAAGALPPVPPPPDPELPELLELPLAPPLPCEPDVVASSSPPQAAAKGMVTQTKRKQRARMRLKISRQGAD